MKFPHKLYLGIVMALAVLALFGVPRLATAADDLGDSYYALDVPLETHTSETTSFATFSGRPTIVSMFYASCPHVCPMLISTIKQIEQQLPDELRDDLQVVMVSVDPERDTPAALREIAARHDVDDERWTLARTVPQQTRSLAAVLGIKYKQLPDGEFNHTSSIILLDAEGREIARSGKLGSPEPEFVRKVRGSLQ